MAEEGSGQRIFFGAIDATEHQVDLIKPFANI